MYKHCCQCLRRTSWYQTRGTVRKKIRREIVRGPGQRAHALPGGDGWFRDAGIKRPKLKAKIDAVKALRISAAEEPATPADTRPTSSTGLGLVRTRSAQERARREAAEVAEQAAEAEVAEAEAELIAVRNELGVLRGERRGQRGRPGR
jgi:hypothetical protein